MLLMSPLAPRSHPPLTRSRAPPLASRTRAAREPLPARLSCTSPRAPLARLFPRLRAAPRPPLVAHSGRAASRAPLAPRRSRPAARAPFVPHFPRAARAPFPQRRLRAARAISADNLKVEPAASVPGAQKIDYSAPIIPQVFGIGPQAWAQRYVIKLIKLIKLISASHFVTGGQILEIKRYSFPFHPARRKLWKGLDCSGGIYSKKIDCHWSSIQSLYASTSVLQQPGYDDFWRCFERL